MLKDHYLQKDYQTLIDELDNLQNTFITVSQIAENADFITKNEQLAKISRSLEILQALNRKKISHDVDEQPVNYFMTRMYL